MLARIDGIRDLALTTNGVLLADQADALRDAGLQRITVSLDTLSRETFTRLTRVDELARVREGLAAAARVFPGFKIDTVLMRGVNEDEIDALVDEANALGAELRFIEYMDVGGATRWTPNQVFARDEILADACAPRPRRARFLPSAGLRPIASRLPTARSSGSSPRPRRRSAGPATAAV